MLLFPTPSQNKYKSLIMDSPQGVDLSGDGDCNCLGYASRPQQYFLSQHRSLELRKKQSSPNPVRGEEMMTSIKNSGKRSLRKGLRPGYQSPQTTRTIEPVQEYYSQKKMPMPEVGQEARTRLIEERRSVNYPRLEKQVKTENRPPDGLTTRSNRLAVAGWHQAPSPTFYAPPMPLSPPRVLISLPQQPPQPIRINFSHSPPPNNSYRYSPMPSPRQFTYNQREEHKKQPNLSDLKEQLRINIAPVSALPREQLSSRRDGREAGTEEYVDFQLTEDNMDSPRNMPVDRKKHIPQNYFVSEESLRVPPQPYQPPPQQSEYFSFGQTFKSRIDKPKSNSKKKDPFRSRIDTAKSRIDTGKSRIDPKKSSIGEMGKSKVRSLREEKRSLKKMDDVEEIRSMVDSDELSDEDKESVVLGRLHEYGSMLDPSLSLTTPTMRSKLISMNTQSSTIGKSFMRPFEFSIERTHFK